MKVDRRRALALLGTGAATAGAGEAAAQAAAPRFAHGVASGDPAADGAVIWTRVSGVGPGRGVPVRWRVLQSGRPVRSGRAQATADRDGTVKVEVAGLSPGTEYTFDFAAANATSPTGRFRTLPEQASDVVFAVVSCSLHPGGLFNVYDAVAKLPRVDAVLHLGDYIYEYGAKPSDYGVAVGQRLGRLPDPPHEIVTLDDYRRRHAQYKSDPDLQAAHARAAWIVGLGRPRDRQRQLAGRRGEPRPRRARGRLGGPQSNRSPRLLRVDADPGAWPRPHPRDDRPHLPLRRHRHPAHG
jgi:alkaline phosphatase D